MKMSKTREILIEEFLKSLKEDEIPWERGWTIRNPCNAKSNNMYHGVNKVILSYISSINEYDDHRFMTFNQIKEAGYKLKDAKGKGIPIEFWSYYDIETKKTISIDEAEELKEEDPERVKPMVKVYYVFNAKYIEGLEPLEKEEISFKQQKALDFIDNYLEEENIELLHGGNEAAYMPNKDIIIFPDNSRFENEDYYISTLLHEIGHSTGHKTRLNRKLFGDKKTKEYAREELRAEISSSFLAAELDLQMSKEHIENHKAYIQGWISMLENDPNELFRAINDADKIVDYVKDKGDFEKILDTDYEIEEGLTL